MYLYLFCFIIVACKTSNDFDKEYATYVPQASQQTHATNDRDVLLRLEVVVGSVHLLAHMTLRIADAVTDSCMSNINNSSCSRSRVVVASCRVIAVFHSAQVCLYQPFILL